MANKRALPRVEQKLIESLEHIQEKLPEECERCEVPEKVTAEGMVDVARSLYFYRDYYPAVQKLLREATAAKRHAGRGSGKDKVETPSLPVFLNEPPSRLPGCLNRVGNLLSLLKLSEHYSGGLIIQDLNLGLQEKNSEGPATPSFSLRCVEGPTHKIVEIPFSKGGHEGIFMEYRLFGGEWQAGVSDTSKPHLHDLPMQDPNLPEVRQYRLRFWDKGVANGEWSEIKSITIMP